MNSGRACIVLIRCCMRGPSHFDPMMKLKSRSQLTGWLIVSLAVAVADSTRAQVPKPDLDSLVARVSSPEDDVSDEAVNLALLTVHRGTTAELAEMVSLVADRLLLSVDDQDRTTKLVWLFVRAEQGAGVTGIESLIGSIYDSGDQWTRDLLFVGAPYGSPAVRTAVASRLFDFLLETDLEGFERTRRYVAMMGDYGDPGLAYLKRIQTEPRASELLRSVTRVMLARRGGS